MSYIPIIPLIYIEYIFKKQKLNTLYNVISEFKTIFFLSGIVISFFSILAILLLHGFNFDNNQIIVPLSISSHIIGIIIAASLYRIQVDIPETGERYNYISSSIQISMIVGYAMPLMYLPFTIMWIGYTILYNFQLTTVLSLDYISNQTISSVILLLSSLYMGILIGSQQIPKFISGAKYTFNRKETGLFVLKLIISSLSISYIIKYLYLVDAYYSSNTYYLVLVSLPVIFTSMFLFSMNISLKICNVCNIALDNGVCWNCLNQRSNSFSGFNTVYPPKCPSCNNEWDSISRICSNCGYTIVLTCNNCGQIINPLWESCVHCNAELKPLPQQALMHQKSQVYASSISYLRIILSVLVFMIAIEFILILQSISIIIQFNLLWSYLIINVLNITRVLILMFSFTIIIYVLLINMQETKKAMGIIAAKLIIAPFQIIFLMSIIILINKFAIIFWNDFAHYLLLSIFFPFICIFILYKISRSLYMSVINFRPVIPFKPEYSMVNNK